VHLAHAIQTLQKLIDEGQEETTDFCYLDAIKIEYDEYYEIYLKLMKKIWNYRI
jgi:predicted O-methyltransferase YrrM